jgi:hypothetical protein
MSKIKDDLIELCHMVNIRCFKPLSFGNEYWYQNEWEIAEQILCEKKFYKETPNA